MSYFKDLSFDQVGCTLAAVDLKSDLTALTSHASSSHPAAVKRAPPSVSELQHPR